MDPHFKSLYTASMTLETFLSISVVRPVYFIDLLSSPHPSMIRRFSGSAVLVYGSAITTNASGSQNPTWECFIDNTNIGSFPAPSSTTGSFVAVGKASFRNLICSP